MSKAASTNAAPPPTEPTSPALRSRARAQSARPLRTFKRYNSLLGRAPAGGGVPERERCRQRKSL